MIRFFAVASASTAVVVALFLLRRRQRRHSSEELTAEEAKQRYLGLPPDTSSPRIVIRGLRAAYRQKLSKRLHFLGLRSASGHVVEGILKEDMLGCPLNPAPYQLGDVVSVGGRAEVRKGLLSILVDHIEVEEAWEDVFPKAWYHLDWDLLKAAGSEGNVLLQVATTHVDRLTARLDALPGVRVLGLVRPISQGVRHVECGLLVQAGTPLPALVGHIRADAALPDKVIQRIYPLQERLGTVNAAVKALVRLIGQEQRRRGGDVAGGPAGAERTTGSAGSPYPPLSCRVICYPRSLEPRVALQLHCEGIEMTLRGHQALACVSLVLGAYAVGLIMRDDYGGALWAEAPPAQGGAGSESRAARQKAPERGLEIWAGAPAAHGGAASDSRAENKAPEAGVEGSGGRAGGRRAGTGRGERAGAGRAGEGRTEQAGQGRGERAGEGQDAPNAPPNPSPAPPPSASAPPVCRAYFKLQEAGSHLDLGLGSHLTALDVGSSPGGWTSYLAQAGCAKVWSVDPGLLDPGVLALPAVEHLKMKIEDALPLLTRKGVAGTIGLYCCDMNAPPAQAVKLFLRAVPLLRPGAAVVLTFKNTLHNPRAKKAEWEADVAAGVEAMGETVEGVRVVQLFANTPRECTVLGRVISGIPQR